MASRKKARLRWYRADLHIHTPASADYMDKQVQYIDILRTAEQRGVDILALTDHNTVNGYVAMQREIEQLLYLEQLGRAQPDELRVLAEYRRLLDKILVLPGFEFTATFGFHILGIFSQQTPVRQIEHILLRLNIPPQALDEGSSQVGASSDVLTAYQMIHEAGGIVIAAHANTTHGVAMRGMDFGGQTRIAYTQDRYLHALEVTDLGKRGRTTQRFFDGTKSEYPRRMRCIQGSDSHNLEYGAR
jgi:PHP family Zn ribbon phosphoesterase